MMEHTSVTRLRRWKQENQELKVILDCMSSPGSVSKMKTNKQTKPMKLGGRSGCRVVGEVGREGKGRWIPSKHIAHCMHV